MSVSDKVKGLLALCGKKQVDMAASFGMSKQTMGNKMNRGSWSANDLAKAAEFCGCKLAFIMPDGQQIIIDVEEKEKAGRMNARGLGAGLTLAMYICAGARLDSGLLVFLSDHQV